MPRGGDSANGRGAGRRAGLLAWAGAALFLAVSSSLTAQTDTTPPDLAGFSFSPTAIDTTDGPASVEVTFHATDDLSGVASVRATFTNRDFSSDPLGCESAIPDSGTGLDGTYSCSVVFPRFSNPGTWQVLAVELTDAADNSRLLLTAALAGLSFPTDLEVTTEPDLASPVLAGFSFLPMAIDASTAAVTVQATFHLTDDRSGVAWAKVNFIGPGGAVTHGCTAQVETPGQEAALDVMISCAVSFPAGSPSGTWSVVGVDAADAAGNNAAYPTSGLLALGFPASLLVTSQADTTPPALTGFSFSPLAIDTETSPALVEVNFTVSDDLSGVASAAATFVSPGAPPQSRACSSAFPASGSPLSGAYRCLVPFSATDPEGAWGVSEVEILDASGQALLLATPELAQAGFPVNLASGFPPGPPRAAIEAPEAGRSIRGDRVTVAARLVQGSPAGISPTAGVRLEVRSLPFGSFTPIPAAEAGRPNPDPTYPFFIHWSLAGLADGDYELRAVAHDLAGNPDPAPASIPIQVANGSTADIEEGPNAGGRPESRTMVDGVIGGTARAGDTALRGGFIRFAVPPGALGLPADTLRMVFPDEAGELPFLEQPEQSTGIFVELTLESGQEVLPPGAPGTLDLQYLDADSDGVLDGTGVPEKDVELRRFDEGLGRYVRLPPWSLLTEHNQVRAVVTLTGRFALTRSLEPRIRFHADGSTLEWDAITEAVSYHVYRGALGLLQDGNGDGLPDGGYGDCQDYRDPLLTDTLFLDPDGPGATGSGFLYLVSFDGLEGERGLGSTSRGVLRSLIQPCP